MEGTIAAPRVTAPPRSWPIAVAASVAVPLGLLVYFLTPPVSTVRLDNAVQHFAITTNVSLIAAAVSIVVARQALDLRHWPSVLVALGFMCMAGVFAVHGLATPGVLLRGESETQAGAVVALSAQLSVGIPAWLFAARYTPIVGWLRRSRLVTPERLLAVAGAAIAAYGLVSLTQPSLVASALDALTGYNAAFYYGGYGGTALQGNALWVVLASGSTLVLLAFAAQRQSAEFARSRLPSHAALSLAYLLLAEAQVAMVLGPAFSLAFWDYHGLMALATVLALGALVLELDRRRGLERFLPPTVVERVIVGDRLSLEGERRTATILFTDLRGSTALAERVAPEAAVAAVNSYLRAMARAVLDEGGILDKFTGDGLMAIFGAMSDPASGATAAARAALRMRHDINALNTERAARGEPTVGYGVGINTGEVVLGAVGLPERSDYTAMGDTVNTAARMESLTKELGVDVVVSEPAARQMKDGIVLRPLGEAIVKGKSSQVAVFTIA